MCASQPASGAIARSAAMIRSQTPAAVQRWSRRQAVRQFISSGGRSRHGAPVLASQSTASMNVRWSREGRPVRGFWGGSKGARRCHIASYRPYEVMTDAGSQGKLVSERNRPGSARSAFQAAQAASTTAW